ncbi:MAG: HAD family phosphatase [Lachnospiraceae bacterium]|nr:HAD family phosphatase [Lachnospiraceae bacterium]
MKLVALDLDGTLFNNEGKITEKTKQEIKRITKKGVHVVISTGRPYNGVPFAQIKDTGIDYAIVTNGSAIYRISTNECLYENCMDFSITEPILRFLLSKEIHIDTYINGEGFTPTRCRHDLPRLNVLPSLKEYILATRTPKDDLLGYVRDCGKKVQKMTLNFYPQPDGTPSYREEVRQFLIANPKIECVCGGYNNLEFTKAGVTKGKALKHLAELLSVSIEQTMAIGDTENDISILNTANIGVAMGNATPEVKALSDYVTTSNEEDGVANAILHFVK